MQVSLIHPEDRQRKQNPGQPFLRQLPPNTFPSFRILCLRRGPIRTSDKISGRLSARANRKLHGTERGGRSRESREREWITIG